MAIEPLHVRLRAAAFRARSNSTLSALLLEAAAAVPRPKGDQEPRRDTMAVLAAHAAARNAEEEFRQHGAPARVVEAVAAYRPPPLPPEVRPDDLPAMAAAAFGADLATCGHCGEEYARGVTYCPECSARVA